MNLPEVFIIKVLIKLINLKSILSLLFCITTCYLAVQGMIEMETFMAMTMSILTYYFICRNNNHSDKEGK